MTQHPTSGSVVLNESCLCHIANLPPLLHKPHQRYLAGFPCHTNVGPRACLTREPNVTKKLFNRPQSFKNTPMTIPVPWNYCIHYFPRYQGRSQPFHTAGDIWIIPNNLARKLFYHRRSQSAGAQSQNVQGATLSYMPFAVVRSLVHGLIIKISPYVKLTTMCLIQIILVWLGSNYRALRAPSSPDVERPLLPSPADLHRPIVASWELSRIIPSTWIVELPVKAFCLDRCMLKMMIDLHSNGWYKLKRTGINLDVSADHV